MIGTHFYDSTQIRLVKEGVIPLDNIHYAYGYGVYETLRLRKGILYHPEEHLSRLYHSADILGLSHPYGREILKAFKELIVTNQIPDANIKVHLLGGNAREEARLYIYLLPPLYPTRRDKNQGVKATLFQGERFLPQAKSMNMLMSTIAFRQAREQGAHDALLVNNQGEITEGTRSNLFYIWEGKLYTPPEDQVLHGVTRETLLQALKDYPVYQRSLKKEELPRCEALFLTSTSVKILPVQSVCDWSFPVWEGYKEMRRRYELFLTEYQDKTSWRLL